MGITMINFLVSCYDNIVWLLALIANPYEADDDYDLW